MAAHRTMTEKWPPRSVDEIVGEIVGALGRPHGSRSRQASMQALVLSEEETRVRVRDEMAKSVEAFRRCNLGSTWTGRKAQADSADKAGKLAALLDAVTAEMAEGHPITDFHFLPSTRGGVLKCLVAPAEENKREFLDILQLMSHSYKGIEAEIKQTKESAKLNERVPKKGAERDQSQIRAALNAYVLLKRYSLNIPTRSGEAAFARIASLIFELMTSRRNVDLKRVCERCLKEGWPSHLSPPGPHDVAIGDEGLEDARQRAEDAYQARNRWLQDAWRGPGTTALPAPKDGERDELASIASTG